jgi:hypothetical protein
LTPPRSKQNDLQATYTGITAVPASLQSDLVRISKLAKVAQVDLVESVKACCEGSASNPLQQYTSSLESLVSQAVVNTTAIAAALGDGPGSNSTDDGSPPVARLAGRLINNGGVKDCKVRGFDLYRPGVCST